MKKPLAVVLVAFLVILLGVGAWVVFKDDSAQNPEVSNFEECAQASGIIMETYPEQCSYNGKTYTRQVDQPVEIPAN